jgi:predicted DsbA family dithiol-disulfide isomerase
VVDSLVRKTGVAVDWRPLVRLPEIPEEGLPWNLTRAEMERFRESVLRRAEVWNLTMTIPSFRARSVLALQAGEFARSKGCFDSFQTKMFDAYWKEERNVGKLEVVLDVAASEGLDTDELSTHLQVGTYFSILEQSQRELERLPRVAVPTFVIGPYRVYGIQEYDVLARTVQLGRDYYNHHRTEP